MDALLCAEGGLAAVLVASFVADPRAHARRQGIALDRALRQSGHFFAWLPLVGDALCVAAGWLHVNWLASLGFMAMGRLTRYLVLALL